MVGSYNRFLFITKECHAIIEMRIFCLQSCSSEPVLVVLFIFLLQPSPVVVVVVSHLSHWCSWRRRGGSNSSFRNFAASTGDDHHRLAGVRSVGLALQDVSCGEERQSGHWSSMASSSLWRYELSRLLNWDLSWAQFGSRRSVQG